MFKFMSKSNFEENTFANLVSLVGFYENYRNSHIGPINKNEFMEYYNEHFCKDGVHYRTQKRANLLIYTHLRNKSIKCKKNKFKRYYRYKLSYNPQMDTAFYPYFEYIMNYILENEILKELAICHIIQPCKSYSNIPDMNAPYRECLEKILGTLYIKIYHCSCNVIASHNQKERAKNIISNLKSYNKFDDFMTYCRKNHK